MAADTLTPGSLLPEKPARLRSLDVFRGATVALMILVNNPGSWGALYPPLAHAPWHGVTPTDWVFPFFLFAVGSSLALVLPALQAAGPAVFWRRVLQRSLLIVGIGLLLNAAPFWRWDAQGALVLKDWDSLRLMGVLQRIGLCFGLAASLLWLLKARPARVLWAVAALLLGYWAACVAWGAAGDPYSLQGWFGTALDRALLGQAHLYKGEGRPFDPEGLASTAPAVAQVLLGWWAAQGLVQAQASGDLARQGLAVIQRWLVWAVVLLVLAAAWQQLMPMNKKIWTSSYVLHTTGLALLVMALAVYFLELRRPATGAVPTGAARSGQGGPFQTLARLLEAFGHNPLFIFVLSGLVPRFLGLLRWSVGTHEKGQTVWMTPLPWLYQNVFAGIGSDPRLGSALFALAHLLPYAVLAWWLQRRGLRLRV